MKTSFQRAFDDNVSVILLSKSSGLQRKHPLPRSFHSAVQGREGCGSFQPETVGFVMALKQCGVGYNNILKS
jgi:hypothetical protein